jgi:hypothetical protein
MFVVHPTLSEGDTVETCRAAEKVLKAATTGDSREGRRAA